MIESNLGIFTEEVLQRLYKSKTYLRNEEWDVIWYLGGKYNVTIGEREGKFFLLPQSRKGVVTDVLPFELIQGVHYSVEEKPKLLTTLIELDLSYPELSI